MVLVPAAAIPFVWAMTLVPNVVREAAWSGTEIERELVGLLLVAVWFFALALKASFRR